MRYLFIVQGEGRGHMTQAISLSKILRNAGHEIVEVVVGKSPQRVVPDFFFEKIGAPVTLLESPNFATDKHHKSVKPLKTIFVSLAKSPKYLKSIKKIASTVDEKKPDIIINFYDFLGGLYSFFHRPKARFICIAHQYLLEHSEFSFPEKRKLDKISLIGGNKVTSYGAEKLLCLSFQKFKDQPEDKIYVVPPLLRQEIRDMSTSDEGHILVYMVNPGYGSEVEAFHSKRPEVKLECFWDQKNKPNPWKIDENLIFHPLDDVKFLDSMSKCKGYITTAGFESVCEAMYLGKPVMMVPVEGHYEQACNAIDAQKAGAGISSDYFEIEKLVDYLPIHQSVIDEFKPWADRNIEVFLKHLT